jgi:hypothetical protein
MNIGRGDHFNLQLFVFCSTDVYTFDMRNLLYFLHSPYGWKRAKADQPLVHLLFYPLLHLTLCTREGVLYFVASQDRKQIGVVPRTQRSLTERWAVPRALFKCQDQTCDVGIRTHGNDAALITVPGPSTQLRYQDDRTALGSSRFTLVMTPQEGNTQRCRIRPVLETLHPSGQLLTRCTDSFAAELVEWVKKLGEDFTFSEFFDKQICVGATQFDGTWTVTFYWKQPIDTNGTDIKPHEFDMFLCPIISEQHLVSQDDDILGMQGEEWVEWECPQFFGLT